MFNRKKTEAKRFVQIFKPLLSNSLNFKSQILSSVELAFGTDIERGEKTHTFRVTFFFEDGENSSFDNYCWQSEDRLLEAKDLIKRAFSVKTFEEFKTLYIKHNNRL
jgi:hypothetical protein